MTTVGQIAATAFDAVAAQITDAIKAATLTYITRGAYDYATGLYAETETTVSGRSIVDRTQPVRDIFPDYVVGPNENLFLLEGFPVVPRENYILTIGGVRNSVKRVQDILGTGALQYVVALEVPE